MHLPRLTAILVAFGIVLSSCTLLGIDDTTTTTTAALTASANDQVDAGDSVTASEGVAIDVDVEGCGGADDNFELLCEAHDILTSLYVDPLDDAALAQGAIEGLTVYERDPAAIDTGELECAVPSDDFADFCDFYATVQASEGATDESLIAAAIQGMMDFGLDDPNSNYFDPDLYNQFNSDQGGQVQGIGALVNSENLLDEDEICLEMSDTCKMVIVSPLPGSPAEANDIRPGDYIVSVDGDSVLGMTLDEVVSIVRGPADSEVLLGVERGDEIFDILVVRAAVDIPVTEAEMLTEDIGYLAFYSFTSNSAELFRSSLEELLDAGMETLILDLQSNPGGSLDAAVDITSEFLREGLVVTTQSPDQVIEYDVRPGGLDANGDLTIYVLMNEGSASASEVLAGALQDNGRATLVGQNSFGKNTVQRIIPLSNGGGLKVTIARWVTPSGNDFGGDGIAPDIEIPYPEDAEDLRNFLRDEVLAIIEAG